MADWGAIAGLVAQVAGSAAGNALSQMDKDAAMKLIQDSTDAYGKIQVPKLQQLLLQQQGGTNLAGIKDDPRYRDQQNAADSSLNDIISSGGLTLADKANLNAIRNRSAQTETAGRNAILGGMAARGTLDSGAQLAAQLQGNQQDANGLAAADEATAGQAQARAYQAIKDRAALAGQGLDRSYNEQANAARAQDAINAGNIAIMNTAARYNAGIPQQDFNNQLELTNAQTGANAKLAAATAGRAKDTQQTAQGIGNTVAAGAKAFGSSSGNAASSNSNDYAGRGSPSDLSGGGSTGELQGDSTRPLGADGGAGTDGRTIVGYDANGNPVYGKAQGSNF